MKKMKRVIALFLCLLMLSSLAPISVFAEGEVPGDNDVVVTEVCGECGGSGAHTETCSLNTINLMNQNDTVVCTVCGAENCEATHVYCDTCEKYDCGLTHTTCDKCGTVDCQSTHEAWCDTCKKDSCGVDHTTPADNNGETVGGNDVGCNECKQLEGHLDTCSQYKAPVTKCEHCGIELTEGAVHLDTCLTLCTCEPVEGVHQEGCKFYVEPVEEIAEDNGPQVGDKIWIKSGSKVYKNHNDVDKNFRILRGNYQVEIKKILTNDDGVAEWYEFRFTDLGPGEIALSMGGYKYVHVENTSVEEPDEDAGSGEEATVGDTVIRVTGVPEDVSLNVSGVSEEQYHSDLNNYIDQNSELLYVYDITLTNPDGSEWQPQSGQSVTVTLDFMGLGLPDGNKINVLHEHDGELRPLGEYSIEDGKLSFKTDGFSKFYFYITYTFGGHVFTMSGGSTVRLSEILQELSISYSIGDVANVNFSNPDVLKITQIGTDWELESLASFGSEETLTITFTDGEIIEIAVEDPVIYNYAVGSDITKVPKLETKQHTVAKVDNGDQAALGKTYTVNKDQITVDNVKTAGVAEKEAGTHPAPDAVHMIIYATEGMAIDFIGGTDWNYEGSRPKFADSGIWFWSWESSVKANYVVVKDGTVGKQAKFTVTTTVDGTKYYCNVLLCVVENSKPTLLATNLPAGYSIKNVPVTLYNYDGKEWNEHYDKNKSNYFAFSGNSMGVVSTANAGYRGWTSSGLQANGGGGVALMGIMRDTLVDGLPVVSQGQQVDVFSENAVPGKTVYSDVNFQFVYNEKTGYYAYNSALNHAQYNSENKTLELYTQSLAPSDTPAGDSHGNAGFYPFEDINKAYTNTGYTSMDVDTWKAKLENLAFELIPAQYSTDIVPTNSTNPASTADMHYGLQVKSDFYLPKDKKINGQEMIYEFTGDDDLWVFIDGKLVLDIGGGHTYVSGSFNLTTGKVWVEKYTKLAAADGGYYLEREQGTDLEYTDSFLTGLEDDQMHTIQIFYLERHGGVSNCRMHFNLPLVPSGAVNVSKNLKDQHGEELSVTPDVDYTFTLYTAEGDASGKDDSVNATSFSVKANAPYTVTGTGAPTGTLTTDANGQFQLKDGWIASFSNIDRFTEVYVTEANPSDGYSYTKSTVSVNKADATDYTFGDKTETKVMQLNESINFDFVNKMQTQPLTIEKVVVGGEDGLLNPNQEFSFDIVFTKDSVAVGSLTTTGAVTSVAVSDKESENDDIVHLGGTFNLKQGESITIPSVPVNMTYTLNERNPDTTNNSFDDPVFQLNNGDKQTKVWCDVDQDTNTVKEISESFDGTIDTDGNQITVTNQQRFNLIIKKLGIDPRDHDEDEAQSAIFEVTLLDGSKMQVVICGNESSAKIVGLPVGKGYQVVELTDWSWRYDLEGITYDGVEYKEPTFKPNAYTATVTFTNERKQHFWLSGDSYCENWWGGESGTKVVRKDET